MGNLSYFTVQVTLEIIWFPFLTNSGVKIVHFLLQCLHDKLWKVCQQLFHNLDSLGASIVPVPNK